MRKIPTLNAIKAFESAARHQSFKKAGEELFVTSPAISQHVKTLEDWLGVQLFYREPRRLRLTPTGKAYLERLTPVFDELERATSLVLRAEQQATLRIGVEHGVTMAWLRPRIGKFLSLYPDLALEVDTIDGDLDSKYHLYELTIGCCGDGNPLRGNCLSLFNLRLAPVCSPAYAREQRLQHPSDLARCRLLHHSKSVGAFQHCGWRAWLHAVGIEVKQVDYCSGVRFSEYECILHEVVHGRGVAIGYVQLLEKQLGDGTLVCPFPKVLTSQVSLCLGSADDIGRNPYAELFAEWIRKEAMETEDGDACALAKAG